MAGFPYNLCRTPHGERCPCLAVAVTVTVAVADAAAEDFAIVAVISFSAVCRRPSPFASCVLGCCLNGVPFTYTTHMKTDSTIVCVPYRGIIQARVISQLRVQDNVPMAKRRQAPTDQQTNRPGGGGDRTPPDATIITTNRYSRYY